MKEHVLFENPRFMAIETAIYSMVSIERRVLLSTCIGWMNLERLHLSVQYDPNPNLGICLIETLVKPYYY